MNMKKRHQQKLVFLAITLFLIWNVPFITVFDLDAQLFGFPAFYAFVFLSWLAVIIISYIILRKFYE